ncbi:unnamed protein product [Orchesella dallaii]|uniref:Band 7 domain-containing protein n=1 Tax=Orchesella dallaii TaxID=48710 RepID=A0ABP1S779_9HEXA
MGYQLDEEKGAVQLQPQPSSIKDYQDRFAINTSGKTPRNIIELLTILIAYLLTIILFPITCFSSFKTVRQYERAVVFRLGKINGAPKGPGTFFTISWIDDFIVVDMRTINYDIPKQQVLTKDSVTIGVDAVVYYRIVNPILAIANVKTCDASTRLLAATILRTGLGTKTLAEILTEKDSLARQMREELDEATDPWGVKVERIEIKNINLPNSLERSMAAEAEAEREATAKVVAAKGELLTAYALKEAAETLAQSAGALQLRSYQVLANIAVEGPSFMILPTTSTDVFK